jgi:endonuclease/exonuclease/phosphatase family metal-dependent hydrolase
VAGLTFPAHAPREQLDHVLVDGDLQAGQGRVVELPLSDHRARVVDL